MISAKLRENTLTDGSKTHDIILTENEESPFNSSEMEINCVDCAHANRLITELRLANVKVVS